MIARRILIAILVTSAVVFLGLQTFGLEVEAAGVRALLFVLLVTLYWYSVREKQFFFLMFLILYALAEILNFVSWLAPAISDNEIDYLYFVTNSIYILSYIFLILRIFTSINLLEVSKKYPLHILILIILDVLSVVVVTNTAMDKLTYHAYYVEFVYNTVIMVLLNAALINYIHKDDKKAFNLLIGAIFIFFSEVIQLAYFYVSDINLLNVMCSLFLVLAFYLFYIQSTFTTPPTENSLYPDLTT